jgi:hypothetical protein
MCARVNRYPSKERATSIPWLLWMVFIIARLSVW